MTDAAPDLRPALGQFYFHSTRGRECLVEQGDYFRIDNYSVEKLVEFLRRGDREAECPRSFANKLIFAAVVSRLDGMAPEDIGQNPDFPSQ